ncbi:MAG: lantibiotic dehydratase C-terminal domain-containing protein [Pseudonocardiaceae bacterium]
MRFDEILTDHLHRLLTEVTDHMVSWWFLRHHDTTRPETDHHLGLYLRLPGPEDYGAAAMLLANWVAKLRAPGPARASEPGHLPAAERPIRPRPHEGRGGRVHH